MQTSSSQRLVELWPVRALPTLHLSKLGYDLPATTIQICSDGRALGFNAKSAFALATGRNPVISNKLPV